MGLMKLQFVQGLTIAAVACSTALLTVSANAAVDSKIYSGSTCKPGNSVLGYIFNSPGTAANYIQNYAGRIGVLCPVVRDRVTTTDAASVWVNVYDPSTADGLWCGFFASDQVGGTISYGSSTTDNAFVGSQVISMSTPTGTGWWDSLTLVCNVDQNGKIYAYNVDEALQID